MSGHIEMAGKPSTCLKQKALGTTGLSVTQAGFGGYRINNGMAVHERALKQALRAGINLIDTSANYGDGGSETLVGEVIETLVASGELLREEVVVVSKAGYLQGQNFALSQQRKREGRPFPELVQYGEGLEHCIHPDFLADQLDRSLSRLGLENLDLFLLHNPEYYLDWAEKQGIRLKEARKIFYQRIRKAFGHLEKEVENGRIRFYGISSNSFPEGADNAGFVSLETVWELAEAISTRHHFRVVQLPFNLLETGAALEKNQKCGMTVLEFAIRHEIGVLVNRPLNAFSGNHLIRLADIEITRAVGEKEIIRSIRAVAKSEIELWKQILPGIDMPQGLKMRVKEQVAVADTLKYYWKNFGSWERFCQLRDGNFTPRVRGVLDFLDQHTGKHPDLAEWMTSHPNRLQKAYTAVGSIYAESASVKCQRISRALSTAEESWGRTGTLSQKAFRAVRSTPGISSVLVGMRKPDYVDDILEELGHPVMKMENPHAWRILKEELADL